MMPQDASILSVENVTKRFGRVRSVDDVSLEVRKGEFFSLLGGSGSGKTTLLRMIGGFENQCSGTIRIEGKNMANVSARRRPTNMVFQRYAIFPHLTVRENIEYGLANRDLTSAERRRRSDWALEMIKMQSLAGRKPSELSGGQQQRVALARALVCEPKIVLLDEPLGALDKQLREEMQLELLQLQRSVGITFILVTHDQEEALKLSDRIAVMADGRILQVGTATELYEQPKGRKVAEFIGSMNFIDGCIIDVAAGRAHIDAGPLGRLSVIPTEGSPASGATVIAIRPEKLVLSPADHAQSENAVVGSIVAKAYYGDRSHYYVDVPGLGRPLIVARQNIEGAAAGRYDVGMPIKLFVPPDGAILLPAEDAA